MIVLHGVRGESTESIECFGGHGEHGEVKGNDFRRNIEDCRALIDCFARSTRRKHGEHRMFWRSRRTQRKKYLQFSEVDPIFKWTSKIENS